jgi:hypothetical protein
MDGMLPNNSTLTPFAQVTAPLAPAVVDSPVCIEERLYVT